MTAIPYLREALTAMLEIKDDHDGGCLCHLDDLWARGAQSGALMRDQPLPAAPAFAPRPRPVEPLLIRDGDRLGALCAYLCLAIVALLMILLVGRQLWLWWL